MLAFNWLLLFDTHGIRKEKRAKSNKHLVIYNLIAFTCFPKSTVFMLIEKLFDALFAWLPYIFVPYSIVNIKCVKDKKEVQSDAWNLKSENMTSSGKNGFNIRTNASSKLDRTRSPKE